jgi:hypothetical protein
MSGSSALPRWAWVSKAGVCQAGWDLLADPMKISSPISGRAGAERRAADTGQASQAKGLI